MATVAGRKEEEQAGGGAAQESESEEAEEEGNRYLGGTSDFFITCHNGRGNGRGVSRSSGTMVSSDPPLEEREGAPSIRICQIGFRRGLGARVWGGGGAAGRAGRRGRRDRGSEAYGPAWMRLMVSESRQDPLPLKKLGSWGGGLGGGESVMGGRTRRGARRWRRW